MKKEKKVGEAHLQENAPNHLERKRAKKTQTCHHLQRRTPSLRGEEMWRIHSKALVILTVFQIFVASIRNSSLGVLSICQIGQSANTMDQFYQTDRAAFD